MISSRSTGGAFWLSLILPIVAGGSFFIGLPWAFVIAILFVVPALDAAIGQRAPKSGQAVEDTSQELVPCCFSLAWVSALTIGAYRASTSSWMELTGLAIGGGMLSATAMAHLHELTHRQSKIWDHVSDLAFIIAGYPHYRVAHQLHHRHVGNAKFGSAPALGTSVWRHVGRSYAAALTASFSPDSHPFGRVPRSLFGNAFFSVALLTLAVLVHWKIAIFYVGYTIVSVFVVEAVGYMQHYGFDSDRSRTAITSWDVDFWLSNCLLINNGFHNAHHQNGRLPYRTLAAGRVTLPGGYFQMLWLTLLPPLWFSTMNRRARILLRRCHRQGIAVRNQIPCDAEKMR